MGIGFIPNGQPFGSIKDEQDRESEELDFERVWKTDLERSSQASREASEEYKRVAWYRI